VGADGVRIAGCHPGDCYHISGNCKTRRRAGFTKRLLEEFGMEPERLRLEWVSASEETKFAEVVRDFTNKIKESGPNSLRRS
jgi:F420-non-reducing hydrogenase iron-sulfur subunit